MSIFLALSCVSAADDNQTDQISESDEILTADPVPGTFTELNNTINTASSNIIELDKDYKHDANSDSNFTNSKGIVISKDNLIIDGKGHSIDGNKKATIFQIVGSNITLKNIKFTNGYGTRGGSVSFSNSENINIINCNFTNNKASYGGAMHFLKSNNIRIIDSSFTGNTANSNAAGIYFEESGPVDIKNSHFTSNTGGHYGGAVMISYQELNIEDSTFTNNIADGYGGAVYMDSGTIKNCIFEKNYSQRPTSTTTVSGGGAIEGSPLIDNCTFKENYGRTGGAVRGFGFVIKNSKFIQNYAKLQGDALYGGFTLINSTFNAKAGTTLESVYIYSGSTVISDCTFYDKGVENALYSGNATIENSVFFNANIVNTRSNLILYNNFMVNGHIDNHAKILSKVYFIVPNYAQLPTDTLILAKIFDDNGNPIYSDILVQGCFNFIVEDKNGENETISPAEYTKINENWYYKTSVNLDEGNYTVYIDLTDKPTFEKYYSNYDINSGLLEVYDFNNFTTLENDIRNAQGNTITLTKDYVNSLVTESNYVDGIVIDRSNIVIDGAGHTINGATVARIFLIPAENVVLKNIKFTNGFGTSGAAVYSYNNITIINCTFENNRAIYGGAVYIMNGAVINSTFTGNHAKDGGAVYVENATKIEDSTFTSNSAENGGAVYFKKIGDVIDSEFNENTAVNGGAGYFNGNVNINGTSFTSNSAEKGGSTYFKTTGNVVDTTFDSNYALQGGAIFNEATLTITDSTFVDNTAADKSDNIALIDNGNIILNNVSPADLSAEVAVDLSCLIGPRYQYSSYIYYGTPVTLDITVTSNNRNVNTGYVTIVVGNKSYSAAVVNGYSQIILNDMEGGHHLHYLTYYGGDYYSQPTIPIEFSIEPLRTQINPSLPASFVINVDERYTASLNINFNGPGIPGEELHFYVDDVFIGTSITNGDGVGVVDFTADMLRTLKAGYHTLTMVYGGNQNYYEVSNSILMTINKGNAEITAEDATYTIDETPNYTVLIKDINGRPVSYENVTFTVQDIEFVNATDENGIATFAIPYGLLKSIGLGEHSLAIKLDGTNYNVNNKRVTITVEKGNAEIIAPNSNYLINVGGDYSVNVNDKTGLVYIGNVIFTLAGNDLGDVPISNGIATVNIPASLLQSLGYGVYDLVATFDGAAIYNPTNKTAKISINTENAEITAGNVTFDVDSDTSYPVTVTDANGVPVIGEEVTFTLDGETLGTVLTDENGVATISIPPSVGNKNIGVKLTNDKYAAENKTANIVIEKGNTAIAANAASYVINYGGTYSVTLKNVNGKVLAGKTVTFILNGKNIGSAVTDANGVASIKLTAAMLRAAKAGSKNLVIKFNGDSNYNPTSKTVKLTIKKEKTKIAAKKKTFKRTTKTKKFRIALKNSKGKAVKKAKVYLKVGKKTYKAKTNSRGKATFKITKLTKKGKYTAKITFKTNAYFLKATKKVRITVR